MIKLSYSRVSSYLSCPQRHHFSYVERIKPKKVERPLQFGKDFHSLLQHRFDPKALKKVKKSIEDTFWDMPRSIQADLGDNYLDDLFTIFEDYRTVWKDYPKPDKLEHEFLIPIGKYRGESVLFHGIIDEVYPDYMGEHKTFSQRPKMELLAMNTQVCLYAKAYELETGKTPKRVVWDYIRSKPADYPVWLEKSKRFSEASKDNITPYSWLRACNEREISDEAILDKSKLYEGNISNFYFRASVELVPQMIDTVWDSFVSVAKDIVRRGDTNNTKNISRDCSWCSYRAICYTEFTGGDVAYVKNTDYKEREEYGKEEEDRGNVEL